MTQTYDQLLRRLDRPIVLVGLMGAGKSSVGRRVASRLGLEFTDADDEIEQAAGCSIAEYFELYGEASFRDGERRVLARLMKDGQGVLATGGGAFMDPETRGLIKQGGISVWLRASLETLVSRCSRRNHRPLLRTGDPAETLKRLMDQRYPVYAQSDIEVDTDHNDLDKTVTAVVDSVEGWLVRVEDQL
ncbi:MAG: shikimate kinase [Alphaproteobacteria bacterium]